MTDWILFWHRHNQKPELSEREMLWFCARAHFEPPTLTVSVPWFRGRKFRRRSA